MNLIILKTLTALSDTAICLTVKEVWLNLDKHLPVEEVEAKRDKGGIDGVELDIVWEMTKNTSLW